MSDCIPVSFVRPDLDVFCGLDSLGRTMDQRRADILAVFYHRHVTNGPVEAINGRIEHLRGIGLGFRNRTNYETRALIHSGQITHLHQ